MIEKVCWGLIALIHATPALALFHPTLISKMYGIEAGSDSFTLMHHRAGLFVVICVVCLWALFRPEVRLLASAAVGISMGSFVLIWWFAGASPALRGIAIADIIGLLIILYANFQAFRSVG